jgi:predicted ATPase
LVLDKCQHLIGTCAEVLKELLDGCPNLRVLITSRNPCGLPASSRGRVPRLAIPDPDTEPSKLVNLIDPALADQSQGKTLSVEHSS